MGQVFFRLALPALAGSLLAAPPVVNRGGVVNSASYIPFDQPNWGIARGSIFVVFGKELGPDGGAVATSFPLRTELGGVSIRVTVGSRSAEAYMLYALENQLAAVLPSFLPAGDGTLTVARQGETSAPAEVRVLDRAPGIYTTNQQGKGAAVITDAEYRPIDPLAPGHPGQTVILWATGIGPVGGDEASGPLPGNLGIELDVTIGDKPARVIYKGRSGCCAGLDQIIVEVPAVTGCALPVRINTGGRASNTTTMAVAEPGLYCTGTSQPPADAIVRLNPGVRYQTVTGWEATAWAGQDSDAFPLFKDQVFDLAVNDLGINRLRLEVRAGVENAEDYWTQYQQGTIDYTRWRCVRYSTVNDNGDPSKINSSGYQFSELDDTVERIVLPVKQRMEARGEKLYLNVNYVAFTNQICDGSLTYIHADQPEEYGEFVLATYLHLRDKYKLVPDSWEVILEPDNTSQWRGAEIGAAIAAAARRLRSAGFTPRFVAPSTTNMSNAAAYFDEAALVPGALDAIGELSYHRYGGVSEIALREIAERATRYGVTTAMTEHIGSDYQDLQQDLKVGLNSAWQQFGLAGANGDRGGQYYYVDVTNPAQPVVLLASRAKFLRQYFKFARRGAVRIDASTTNVQYDPLAFVNAAGGYVVVVDTRQEGVISIRDLPAGVYGIKYTTEGMYDVYRPDVVVQPGQSLEAYIPAAGVVTVYAKQ
jgi:uncharacterized protein (TIGR03437 family)